MLKIRYAQILKPVSGIGTYTGLEYPHSYHDTDSSCIYDNFAKFVLILQWNF